MRNYLNKPYPAGMKDAAADAARRGDYKRDQTRDSQIDGLPMPNPGQRPTKAISARTSAPAKYATSGMEKALGAHADKVHPTRKR